MVQQPFGNMNRNPERSKIDGEGAPEPTMTAQFVTDVQATSGAVITGAAEGICYARRGIVSNTIQSM